MNKANFNTALLALTLDRGAVEPMHAQLARQLRELILDRRLAAGGRLPPSRVLADELSVSRLTVTTAIEQLISEGYADGRKGSGVYVASDLPDYTPRLDRGTAPRPDPPPPQISPARPFDVGVPDLTHFPWRDWARLSDREWRDPDPALLTRPDPLGWPPLRAAIAAHLRQWRDINCGWSQVIITSGIVESVELISRAVLAEGDRIFVEDPGYATLKSAFEANGIACLSCSVDGQGFNLQRALDAHGPARAAALTPSRQYPLGLTLPLARRLELLEWAAATGAMLIEDDYDSEYRYRGQPLPALMSLDDRDRVIYAGSFSKVLFPTLRLGFLVMPRPLLEAARAAMARTGARASMVSQPVLARFIEEGGFATHLRRMRRLYAQRQKVLVEAIARHANGTLEVEPAPAGMHLIARLAPTLVLDDVEAARRARAAGVIAPALSEFHALSHRRQGLLLGYAGYDEAAIVAGVKRLAAALTTD